MMAPLEAVGAFVGFVLFALLLGGFFQMWHLLGVIRDNTRVISIQLDQLLRAGGVEDPQGDRAKMMKEGRATW